MGTSFYTEKELATLGFKSYGDNVNVSRNAKFYGIEDIVIGNNVRIDDFCILSGKISIGSNVHISSSVKLFGACGIILEDYTGISSNSIIYSAMDDFGGDYLIGPIHPKGTTNVLGGEVKICKYSQIGAGCIVFPNLEIKEGTVIGAMSLVKSSTEQWSVYAGIPARKIKDRKKGLLKFVK
jgi:acetyltransferase-like isoleucine patch superfamily enzyme